MPLTNILLIASILLTLLVVILVLTRRSDNRGAETLHIQLSAFSAELNKIGALLREEFARNREESQRMSRDSRNDMNKASLDSRTELAASLRFFEERTESKLEKIRETVETRLRSLQEENVKKLDEMRSTVDEKLQSTVEKRFNDSFKLISDRLEQVHKGLGEMQTLASGVGDLKKVLTNVKTRGNLGEIQLGAILEEIFSPDQYDKNVAVKPGSQERVEYAIKLPGRNDDNHSLLLPIDSKFPNEDYQRLMEAYENIANLDPKFVDNTSSQFENAVRKCAKEIREKYINPPITTDFAIMFVPTEGLYAEILRRAGLFETLRRDFKVTVVGPTNLVAFLNSLQMGFRTLAIEKRSSEVWEILGAVKTEFSNFNVVLEKTKKKLMEATNSIDKAGVRTRAIERQLRKVQELPPDQAVSLIGQTLDMEAEQIQDEEKDNEE
ncbi:DNA recombination protein RmuC [Puia dinghuensis]|uniref:DNA recombination protein RmuC n=1 Tax=Puia dinghuensis TaxID=1792502 RepID=A0A8J2XWC9_9BACT|nr:DNA recombination protein RmuC [Puia dinghuensis]GGB25466.1 DNA recombination protein RmuC [Puia dinghuensis]